MKAYYYPAAVIGLLLLVIGFGVAVSIIGAMGMFMYSRHFYWSDTRKDQELLREFKAIRLTAQR